MIILVAVSHGVNVDQITPWLLGVNFTIALFSINFTFFGYQLSKYKPIYSRISTRQWLNITLLLSLPFIPLFAYLIVPDYFGILAIWIMPVLMFSAIDNSNLTGKYLTPKNYIIDSVSDNSVSQYLEKLTTAILIEVEEHKRYLDDRKKYQLPIHASNFEPSILGLEKKDIWDSLAVVSKLAVENNDYAVFRQSLSSILRLVVRFYAFEFSGKDSYRINSGIRFVAKNRFRSILIHTIENDKSGIYLQVLSSELCDFLMKDDAINKPCSEMTRAIASDLIWVANKMLESRSIVEPIKILNTLHRVAENSIYELANPDTKVKFEELDDINIKKYAYDIKKLGVIALEAGNSHYAYRCMESLSYLGCNAAKLQSMETIVGVLESLVHLGRVARNLKTGCFWSHCIVPLEGHAEEFIGHILTWLVQKTDSRGSFYMKYYAEQALSRLRGVKSLIKVSKGENYQIQIEDLIRDGESVPHVEYESSAYGNSGICDYSDFTNLKEHILRGLGSEGSARIIRGPLIPLDLGTLENVETDV